MYRKAQLLTLAVSVAVLASAAPAGAKAAPKHAYYQCYETYRDVSQINGEVSYSTLFRDSMTLKKHGVYKLGTRGVAGTYKYKKGHLRFHGGPFDDSANFWHVGGAFYPHGRVMPHSTLADPSRKYTITLRERRTDDSDTAPPFSEFDQRQDATFWYCHKT